MEMSAYAGHPDDSKYLSHCASLSHAAQLPQTLAAAAGNRLLAGCSSFSIASKGIVTMQALLVSIELHSQLSATAGSSSSENLD
jgi:hypothetical protein